MQKYLNSILVLLLLLIMVTCRSGQVDLETYVGKQLSFGNGGGVTGQVTRYILLENGQLFSYNSLTKANKNLKKLPRRKVRQLFAQADSLIGQPFSQPGNRYRFIEVKTPSATSRVTWDGAGESPPAGIEAFYQTLLKLL